MKKILLLLIAVAANLAMASETVEINKVKYTKYSDAEIRGLIGKMNSIQPDMSVDQLTSIMGKPIREQVVSASPPQRIFVYPLSIMVSLYRNSRSREWQVSAPALYGTPMCQREDGIAQKNAIGAEVTEYPSINCIPRGFGPPAPKSAIQQTGAAAWQLLKENPANGNSTGSKVFYDAKNIEDAGQLKKLRLLKSYQQDQQTTYSGTYRSMVELTWVSCDQGKIANGKNLFAKVTEYYSGEMAGGRLTKTSTKEKADEAEDLYWREDYDGVITKKFCQ